MRSLINEIKKLVKMKHFWICVIGVALIILLGMYGDTAMTYLTGGEQATEEDTGDAAREVSDTIQSIIDSF